MKKINFKTINRSAPSNMKSSIYFKPKEVKDKEKEKPNPSRYYDITESLSQKIGRLNREKNLHTKEELLRKKGKFKIGDVVKIITNIANSSNSIGDIGTIIEVQEANDWRDYVTYRVEVPDKEYSFSNYSRESDLEEAELEPIDPPTSEEFLNSIEVVFCNSKGFKIRVMNSRKNMVSYNNTGTSFTTSHISCGITQFIGLNTLFEFERASVFFRNLGDFGKLITEEIYLDLVKQGIRLIFEQKRTGFLLMSTNVTNNSNIDKMTSVLEMFEDVNWTDTHNTNSRNDIRLWICDLYKYQNK